MATPATVKSIMLSSIELQSQLLEVRSAATATKPALLDLDTTRGDPNQQQPQNQEVAAAVEDGTCTLEKIAAAAAAAQAGANESLLSGTSVVELERRLGTTQVRKTL